MPYMLGIDMGGIGVQACETLHWLVVKNRNRIPMHSVPDMIVVFNLQTEEYSGMTLPGEVMESGFDFIKLKVVGEWLSVVSIYEGVRFDVWIMKEYGVEKSWTKLFSVTLDKLSSLRCMRKFVFSEDGNGLLLEMLPGNLVWYNLKEKCIKKVEIHGVVHPVVGEVFHGSLVPLDVGEETDVKKENKESDVKKEPEEGQNRRKRCDSETSGVKAVF
ncbi:hypothetical protein JCGZ_19937 [Jatropha curcas]|uniref:Uncharacterized protein n=1 Tax=Jatropha curcas TaxID=180498 RepID=A0A067JWU4_JATCU|nr:hypothetical protein JCGZ_19937 [Jatropha curcas]